MQNKKLPASLIAWTNSFLSNRQLRLRFNSNTEQFGPIETGIPQGSPISPILFLLYTRDLFETLEVRPLSYIDDVALITSSTSLRKNIKALEKAAKKLYDLGK